MAARDSISAPNAHGPSLHLQPSGESLSSMADESAPWCLHPVSHQTRALHICTPSNGMHCMHPVSLSRPWPTHTLSVSSEHSNTPEASCRHRGHEPLQAKQPAIHNRAASCSRTAAPQLFHAARNSCSAQRSLAAPAPQRQMQPVSPDLLTRAFISMLPAPEREARAVGGCVPQSNEYVMVHGLGLERVMHAPVVPGMRPSAVHHTRTTASAQQLQMQKLQMRSQQMQNQQILQALQHLLLSNAHQQPSGAHAAVLEGLAAQQQQSLQLTTTSMPSTFSQAQALLLDDQPSSSGAPIRRREIPLLKSLTSMQQFWQLWHQGAPLSGIGAVNALPVDEKHKVRQRFSEWKKAVNAI